MAIEYGAVDDTFYFHFAANDTGGSGADGATPICDVRLCGAAADAAPVYEPTPALLTHASYMAGVHEVAIVASVANGFAAGNTYAVCCSLAVDAENPSGVVGKFKLDVQHADVTQWLGQAVTADSNVPEVHVVGLDADVITAAKVAADVHAEAADAVWDEVLTAGTHNVGYSAGQRLRYLILTGATAQAGAASAITLAATEPATDDIFNENIISIVGGTGIGQTRLIVTYDGTTKIATVDRSWTTNPDATSIYEVLPFSAILPAAHGIATAGAASTITLAASASATNDLYNGSTVYISSGTGAGQVRLITDYDGGTKVATVSPEWATNPAAGSIYRVLPIGRSVVDSFTTGAIIPGSFAAGSIDANALAADASTEIVTALWASTAWDATGTLAFGTAFGHVWAVTSGNVARTGDVYVYDLPDDGTTAITETVASGSRTRS